jgi:hypothetical protein
MSEWKMVPVEPTEAMKRVAVVYANGNAVYKNVAAEALKLEEDIYGECYEAMIAAAPPAPTSTLTIGRMTATAGEDGRYHFGPNVMAAPSAEPRPCSGGINLPPLPDYTMIYGDGYSRDSLRAYARTAVLADRQERAALPAEPSEPVAYMLPPDGGEPAVFRLPVEFAVRAAMAGWTPLYAAPPALPADAAKALAVAILALDEAVTYVGSPSWSPSMERECREAAAALRAQLSKIGGGR